MNSDNISFISETLSQLDELNAATYLSAADKRDQQANGLYQMAGDTSTPDRDRAKIRAAAELAANKYNKLVATGRARNDRDDRNAGLQQLGLDHKHSALLRKAGLGSAPPPRRQDESKVFRIYRNSDQSATVVMESGVAVWLAPKSVNKVLSESGNINRTKLHRLLESRIWK